jgi:hypothetical protein
MYICIPVMLYSRRDFISRKEVTFYQNKLAMRNNVDGTSGKPIAHQIH